MTYLFIAHDLAAVRHLSNRIAVMYLGHLVEVGPAETLTQAPRHPYTQALISAVTPANPVEARRRQHQKLHGELPSPLDPPTGCPFHPRCPIAIDQCREEKPRLAPIAERHEVACHRVDETRLPQNGGEVKPSPTKTGASA